MASKSMKHVTSSYFHRKYTKQTPMQLFEDGLGKNCVTINQANQDKTRSSFSSSIYNISSDLSSITPPMTKKTAIVPNAPIKFRKSFTKLELKPKKLVYTDKYKDFSQDSGMYTQSFSKHFSINADFRQAGSSTQDLTNTCETKEKSNTEILDTKIKNMHLETRNKKKKYSIDKERYKNKPKNNLSTIKEHPINNKRNSNNLSHSPKLKNSSGLNKFSSVLSQCGDASDWQEMLLWLQPRRDVGIMIECCREQCKKWRYTNDYHDPTDVPKYWYCNMNSDKTIASCLIPEVPISKALKEDLIENKYNAGSIVWGHIKGYPWWPAIVDDCPQTFRYYELRKPSIIPVKYHVTFFMEDSLQRAWLDCKNIKPFIKNKRYTFGKRTKFHGIDYKESLKKAYALARSAIPLSILERLQNFSYVSLYEKMQNIISDPISCDNIKNTNNASEPKSVDSDDDSTEIPGSQYDHITLEEFANNIKNTEYFKKHTSPLKHKEMLFF